MSGMNQDPDSVLRLPIAWRHQGSEHINVVRWSSDDTSLAVAYADGSLAVLDAKTGESRWRQVAHGIDTSALQWSPDGKLLASAGQRGGVRIWDSTRGDALHEIDCGSAWIQHLSWGSNGLLACASGKVISLWSSEGNSVQKLDPSSSTVTGLHWLSDGRLCSSSYGMVSVWNPKQKSPQKFFPWKDSLLALTVSPDERFIAAPCQDNSIHLWFLSTGKDLRMGGYPAKIKSMAWSTDSRYLATASEQMVVVWDCAGNGPSGTEPKVIPVHQKAVSVVSFSHSSHRLGSASHDGLVFVYDLARDDPIAGLYNDAPVTTLTWSHDDTFMAIGGEDGSLQVCSLPG